ncbi:MAG TPA: membrane protein insertase YidC [Thermoanaerobaculia bacterium]|nr:membrane protein insertase YidC [Thermoanaerobaculia bacterium]
MEKRIFLAIVISLGLLWLWAAVAPKIFPELARKPAAVTKTTTSPSTSSTKTTTTSTTGIAAPIASTPPLTASTPVAATAVQQTVVDTPEFHAIFSNRGAQLVSFHLKKYNQKGAKTPVELVKTRDPHRTDYPFAIESRDVALTSRLNSALYAVDERIERGARVIEYRYAAPDGVSVTKTFRLSKPFLFDFAVAMHPATPYRITIGPGLRTLSPEEADTRVVQTGNGIVQIDGRLKVIPREKGDRFRTFDAVDFVGIEDNYFMSVLRPSHGNGVTLRRVLFKGPAKDQHREDLYASVNAANDGSVTGEAFFGPKETKLLDSYGMGSALQFGWFGIIGRFFLKALVWINQATKNYGFAIIVLTILIKVVLYPLQHKSIVSMKKMQKAQPKVEAIKAKYKKSRSDAEQRQKMNVEMMQLYQKEGINPMAGCLPIVLQLPILWGFYGLLSRAIELRGAPFILWIHDLSDKDPTYILPILMTATMFIQTYITPSTGDPNQRRMFLIMPVVMGFLFKDFPSGLVLYWLVQNILTIVQQSIMNRWWKEHPAEIQNA